MQGRKKYQRRQWIRDQEVYFGTKHQLTTIVGDDNRITFRCYTPTGDGIVVQPDYTLNITPFCDMYLSVMFGNGGTQQVRAKAGVEYPILCPLPDMDDTQVTIYCANRIAALGDLSACYIAANNFSMATKLKKLILGNSISGYNNDRLVSLSLGNNTLLEELDITNCQNLSGAMDFNQYNNLTTFLAEGTGITSVIFAPSSKIKTAHLPDTVNTLEMQNLDKLTDFQASLSSLEKLTLRGGIISHKELLNKCIDTLKELYLYDINWTGVNSLPDTSLINQLLPSGALQNNLTNMFSSKITGFAYIDNEAHNRELVAYANTWRDLDVRCASVIPQFKVKFVNYDGTVFDEQIVDRNEDAVEPIAAGRCQTPTRPRDAQYTYAFSGWSDTTLTNITSDKTITAQYTNTVNTYRVRFISGDEVLQVYPNIPYGSTATYTESTPQWSGEGIGFFTGWSPSGSNIKGDTDCYAQFDVTYVPSSVKSLANCTWAEIKVLAKDGYLNSNRQWCYKRNGVEEVWFNIGDEKDVTFSDGEVLTFQIYDFNHDDKVSGGKAAFTFGMKNLNSTVYQMWTSSKAGIGWDISLIRKNVMPLYYDKAPSDLKECIEEVYKKGIDGTASNNVITSIDKLWLLSYREVNGGSGYTVEGSTYPIFTNSSSRVKRKSNGTGDAKIWYTRSPKAGGEGYWWVVDEYGHLSSGNGAKQTDLLCFCFCI